MGWVTTYTSNSNAKIAAERVVTLNLTAGEQIQLTVGKAGKFPAVGADGPTNSMFRGESSVAPTNSTPSTNVGPINFNSVPGVRNGYVKISWGS